MIGPRWMAAGLGALLVGSLAADADAQRSIALERKDRRFDHDAHAELVKAAGEKEIGCDDDCHTVDAEGAFQKSGGREHSRCLGACHDFTTDKRRLRGKTGRSCFACHGTKLRYRPSDLGPIYAETDDDYATVYSHKRHTMTGARSGRQCEGCHGKFGDAPPRTQGALSGGHRFCAGCHERGVEPLMHQCASCHVDESNPRFETPVAAKRAKSPYAVGKAFSHPRHARQDRVGTEGRECLTCHANIAEAKSDTSIPLPTMEGCYETCHDGKQAFSATGAQCSRCHPSSSAKAPKVKEILRFSHADHAERGVQMTDCKSCHLLDDEFKVLPPTTGRGGHQPCAESECHADQFFSREPTICSVCHDSFAPFAQPKPVIRRRKASEFGGDLSHVSHTKKVGSGAEANATCEACHGDVYQGTEPPGGGHATCAPCHSETAQPTMERCDGCHELGKGRAALTGGASKWSVAQAFTHDAHENDPRPGTGETRCVECHQSIPEAKKLSDIQNPTMASCDGCHDGGLAFKTTGFECYRCHGEP